MLPAPPFTPGNNEHSNCSCSACAFRIKVSAFVLSLFLPNSPVLAQGISYKSLPEDSHQAEHVGGATETGSSVKVDLSAQELSNKKPQTSTELSTKEEIKLETVTVTAQRQVENIQDVPLSISRISQRKLEALKTSGEDIRKLSGQAPSLIVEGTSGRFNQRFFLRGYGNTSFSAFATQPVGLVYDNVTQNNGALKGTPLFDVEGIEVLRGPQGTLYGRNTPAGLIKIRSRKPTFDGQKGYFNISNGSNNTSNLTGAYNAPLSESLAIRAAILVQHRDDFVDNIFTGLDDDLGGYDDRAYRLQMLYKPDNTFSALLNVHGRTLQSADQLFRANAFQPGGSGSLRPDLRVDEIATDGASDNDSFWFGTNAQLTWTIGDLIFESNTGYEGLSDSEARTDVDGGNFNTTPFPVETSGERDIDQVTQTLDLASNYVGRFNWRAGISYFYEQVKSTSNRFNVSEGGEPTSFDTSMQTTNAGALYVSTTLDLTDRIIATVGSRFTFQDKEFEVIDTFNFGFTGPDSASDTSNFTSFNGSLTYAVRENIKFYVRAGTGSRAPSFAAPNAQLPITGASEEEIFSQTVGIKSTLLQNRLRANVAVFNYTVDDLQISAVGGQSNIVQFLNAEEAEGVGVEADIEARLTPALRLTIGGSYTDTSLNDDNLLSTGCGADCIVGDPEVSEGLFAIDGNSLPRAPEVIVAADLEYVVPLRFSDEFYVYTDWSYRSEYNIFLYESNEFTAPDLLTAGLRGGYRWDSGKYELAVFCRNCTDEFEAVGAVDFNNLTAITTEPRVIGAQFKMNF